MKNYVLAIDNNSDIRRLIEVSLRDKFDVSCVQSVEEALLSLSNRRPDLIVTDLMMEGMGGLELCSHLQSHDEFRSIPVIILSAKTGTNARCMSYKLGALAHMGKPFDPKELSLLIESFLRHFENLLPEVSLCSGNINKKGFLLDLEKHSVHFNDVEISLTKVESQVFAFLLNRIESVCKRDDLMEIFGGEEKGRGKLDTHIKNLRKKITKLPLSISTIYGEGYSLSYQKDSIVA